MGKVNRKPGWFKWIRNIVVSIVATFLARTIPHIPMEKAQLLGEWIGFLYYLLPGRRKQRVVDHLQIAFPDGAYTAEYRRKLLLPAFVSTVQVLFEAIKVQDWRDERDDWRVQELHRERWEKTFALAQERNCGVVLYTAHLGTVELFGRWFASHCNLPLLVVASHPGIEALEAPMRRVRECSGLRMVFRGEAGIASVRHLKKKGALILFVDYNLRGPGVEVPFLGKPAHTLLAPARLALQTGSVTNTIFGVRDGRGRFLAHCGEPMIPPKACSTEEGFFRQQVELTLGYTRRIEEAIRQYPEQYLWMHKRWRKRSESLPFPQEWLSSPSPYSPPPK